jgi:hypothetical protein
MWVGQGVSLVGTQITLLGLPLAAVLVANATPEQMGILVAAENLPILLLILFIGVWVDRVRRRPLLIAADLLRAAIIGSVPVMAVLGQLRIEFLYVVALCMGALTICADTATPAYIPAVVDDEELASAFSASGVIESGAEVLGPGLAGVLIQIVSAPIALLLDAASYLISGLLLASIRVPEQTAEDTSANVISELRAGMHAVLSEPTLRAIAGCIGTAGIFIEMRLVLLILFATRELGINSVGLGVIVALGSVGGMFAAASAPHFIARFGALRVFVLTALLLPAALIVTPLAMGSPLVAAAILVVGQVAFQVVLMASNVTVRLLRQTASPPGFVGRVTATTRLLTWGALPLGALLGGILGQEVGLRPALTISAVGVTLGWLWLLPLLGSQLRSGLPALSAAQLRSDA